MTSTPLIFIDTETTGLRPDIHTPWDIAMLSAVHTDDGIHVYEFHQRFVELYPDGLAKANGKSLEIGHFAERYDAEQAVAPSAVVTLIQNVTHRISRRARRTYIPAEGMEPVHLVGAVPGFDHNMICQNWTGWPDFGQGIWHYHLVDVETLAAGKLRMPPPWDSADLCRMLGVSVPTDTKHTALGDVLWALRLYAAVFETTIAWHTEEIPMEMMNGE